MADRSRLSGNLFLGITIAAAACSVLAVTPPSQTPTKAQSASAAALLRFSEPVNGLVGRIEGLQGTYGFGDVLFVRLENRGTKPLDVPTRNPRDPKETSPFALYGRSYGEWKPLSWRLDQDRGGEYNHPFKTDPTWSTIALQPGESALALLGGYYAGRGFGQANLVSDLAEVKIVLNRDAADGRNAWTGTLETPPYPLHSSSRLREALAGQVPMPTYFPPFRPERTEFMSGRGGENDLTRLSATNRHLICQLRLCRSEQVARELEKRIDPEKDAGLQEIYTVYMYAAAAGDIHGQALRFTSGYASAPNSDALKVLDEWRRRDGATWRPTPEWITNTLIQALEKDSDRPGIVRALGETRCAKARALLEKLARSPKHSGIASEALARIGDTRSVAVLLEILPAMPTEASAVWDPRYMAAQPVVKALVKFRAKQSVPTLIELAKKSRGEQLYLYAEALAELGDPRAIPPLIELLDAEEKRSAAKKGRDPFGNSEDNPFVRLIRPLVNLRAKEAVPFLLRHLDNSCCVAALGELGDPRAAAPLEELAAAKGKNCSIARAALHMLGGGDPTDRYLAVLADRSLDKSDRVDAVWLLARSLMKPHAIPPLVELIKNDPDCGITRDCIYALGQIRHPAAAEALIGCFDFDFTKKTKEPLGMYHIAAPPDFPEYVAEALRQMTGANIGTNKAHWHKWWAEEGKKGEWL